MHEGNFIKKNEEIFRPGKYGGLSHQGHSWVGCRGGFMWGGVRGPPPGKFFRFKVAKPPKI